MKRVDPRLRRGSGGRPRGRTAVAVTVASTGFGGEGDVGRLGRRRDLRTSRRRAWTIGPAWGRATWAEAPRRTPADDQGERDAADHGDSDHHRCRTPSARRPETSRVYSNIREIRPDGMGRVRVIRHDALLWRAARPADHPGARDRHRGQSAISPAHTPGSATASARLRRGGMLLPGGVVLDLIPGEQVDGEVAGLGVGEVEAADGGGGVHGEALGEPDPGRFLDVEEVPERPLLGVVGAGGIAGGGADAAVLLVDQVVGRERLVPAVAPVAAGLLVEHLGERLGQAVGQGLGHDRVVVVVRRPRTRLASSSAPMPVGHGEGAEVVDPARSDGRDVVGQAPEGLLPLALPLLAEGVDPRPLGRPRLVGIDHDVVAVGVGREEAVDAVGAGTSFSATIRSSRACARRRRARSPPRRRPGR